MSKVELRKNDWLVGVIGLTSLLTIIVVFILFMITELSGCEESQKAKPAIVTDPISILVQPPKAWFDKYGDSKESRLIFAMMVLDVNNLQQHKKIARAVIGAFNSITDPNNPNNKNLKEMK